jgi:hypothetical protein
MSRGEHAATRHRPPTLPRSRHPYRSAEPADRETPREAEPPAPVPTADILVSRPPRRRLPVVALVVALLVAVAAGGVLYGLRSDPAAGGSGAVGRQSTLLVQVRGDDGSAVASALYGSGGGQDGVAVLLPSRVIAVVPGAGEQMLGGVLGLDDGTALARSTVADLLGVRVDSHWVLDRAALVALVDAVDGVVVDLATDLVRGRTVVVPAGGGRPLTGEQAAMLLLDRPADTDDIQYQPRVQAVLQSVLTRLPADVSRVVSALPASSRPDAAALRRLPELARASADRSLLYQTLPVKALDTDGTPTYSLDTAGVDSLVRARLASAVLPGRGQEGKRVLVVNGAGTPGLGQSVRNRIVPKGFTFVGSRNETPFGRGQTVVVAFSGEAGTLARAAELARAVGLPEAEVQVSAQKQSIADLMVVVGRDFRP